MWVMNTQLSLWEGVEITKTSKVSEVGDWWCTFNEICALISAKSPPTDNSVLLKSDKAGTQVFFPEQWSNVPPLLGMIPYKPSPNSQLLFLKLE